MASSKVTAATAKKPTVKKPPAKKAPAKPTAASLAKKQILKKQILTGGTNASDKPSYARGVPTTKGGVLTPARSLVRALTPPETALSAVGRLVESPLFVEDAFRQTGRTTRMLEEAAEVARKGTPVLIIVKDEHTVDKLLNTAKFYANTQVNIRSHNPKLPLFDWTTLEPIAPEYQGWKVFVDHACAFSYHRHILDLLGWVSNSISNETSD